MKYIKKYASATKETLQKDDFLRAKEELPCLMCGEPTPFVDIYSEGRFCSDACCDAFYKQAAEEVHKDIA